MRENRPDGSMRGGGENHEMEPDNYGPFNPSRLTLPTLLEPTVCLHSIKMPHLGCFQPPANRSTKERVPLNLMAVRSNSPRS
jgi:hypothetical protein